MSAVIIIFPPLAGGNHLKNIVSLMFCRKLDQDILALYENSSPFAHDILTTNFGRNQIQNAIANQNTQHVLQSHFGVFAGYDTELTQIIDKKFIILSATTVDDWELISNRGKSAGIKIYGDDHFKEFIRNEVGVLYQSSTVQRYFQTCSDNILNIAISELFKSNIDPLLKKLADFLGVKNFKKEHVNNIHTNWVQANDQMIETYLKENKL